MLPELKAEDDTGVSSTDNVTNQLSLDFQWPRGSATTEYQYRPGELLANGEIAYDAWSVPQSATTAHVDLPHGSVHVFAVRAIDAFGVAGEPSARAFVVDSEPPTVTINQADSQSDPTKASTILFTVAFSEPVSDFATGDVSFTGSTAPGALIGTVTGSGTAYTVAVSGMSGSGTVVARLAAGVAHDVAGNGSSASTSIDAAVAYDVTPPTVTGVTPNLTMVADGNVGVGTFTLTVVYNEAMNAGTAPTITFPVENPSGALKPNLGQSRWANNTTYVAKYDVIDANTTLVNVDMRVMGAKDLVGNTQAQRDFDHGFSIDMQNPTVSLLSPSDNAVVVAVETNLVIGFSESVKKGAGYIDIKRLSDNSAVERIDVNSAQVTVSGTQVTIDPSVTLAGSAEYYVELAGGAFADMNGNAWVGISGQAAWNFTAGLTATVTRSATQANPANKSPLHFTVTFSDVVKDFAAGDVTLTGTAPGKLRSKVTRVGTSGITYDVSVSGMKGTGTVMAGVGAGGTHDAAGIGNFASNTSMTTYDVTKPTVTINQVTDQPDPTNGASIRFTTVFSEAVTGFAPGDVTLSGTASGKRVQSIRALDDGRTYEVVVSGMTKSGTVIASIKAGVVRDAAGNTNRAATSWDKTVTYDVAPPRVTINQAKGQKDAATTSPFHFTVVFSEPVRDFGAGDVSLGGTANATIATVTATGTKGTTYDVSVSGMTGSGTVIVSLSAGVAHDAAGNANLASTSRDNTVTYRPTIVLPARNALAALGQDMGQTSMGSARVLDSAAPEGSPAKTIDFQPPAIGQASSAKRTEPRVSPLRQAATTEAQLNAIDQLFADLADATTGI